MKPIELQIFYLTEDQSALVDMGIDVQVDIESLELRPETFYHINSVSPYKHNGENIYSKVYSNGNHCICNLSYQELKKKLEE